MRWPPIAGADRGGNRARRVRGDARRVSVGGRGAPGARRVSDPLAPREVPLLTPELPGTSGSVRVSEEDFRVEELPLYEPSGSGGHLHLTIEKSGRTTPEVARELAAALGTREREIGYAGLK